ncbi:unnamed protein product [Acanthoscelides obtectus]|uniref:Uncharacterized protein n=1 Tax=Acanthoscelides obtectus TaxID=200917 RepID=A0A9P0KSJ1_ACAOB|nr:unnamed protein product [Acanthoscelides obtectus]CAK1682091.1 hypothetical protein AOBTE_LOCUS33420 [Acanthoscelides obtectus]
MFHCLGCTTGFQIIIYI